MFLSLSCLGILAVDLAGGDMRKGAAQPLFLLLGEMESVSQ